MLQYINCCKTMQMAKVFENCNKGKHEDNVAKHP